MIGLFKRSVGQWGPIGMATVKGPWSHISTQEVNQSLRGAPFCCTHTHTHTRQGLNHRHWSLSSFTWGPWTHSVWQIDTHWGGEETSRYLWQEMYSVIITLPLACTCALCVFMCVCVCLCVCVSLFAWVGRVPAFFWSLGLSVLFFFFACCHFFYPSLLDFCI